MTVPLAQLQRHFANALHYQKNGEDCDITSDTFSAVQILSELDADQQPLEVLDAGGGLAQMSQKLAKLGHRIALCELLLFSWRFT